MKRETKILKTEEDKLEEHWNISSTELESFIDSIIADLEDLVGRDKAIDLRDLKVSRDTVILTIYIEKVVKKKRTVERRCKT